MSKLIRFEFLRALRNKTVLSMALVTFLIGILGIILTYMLSGDELTINASMVGLYNAYTQFTYLILGVPFIFTFTKDFQQGSYQYFKQLGFCITHQFAAKSLPILTATIPVIVAEYLFTIVAFGVTDFTVVLQVFALNIISLLFVIILSALLAMLFKRILTAIIVHYSLFLISNVVNLLAQKL